MFVPAHNQKLLDSAVKRDADVLLLDIEDSVPYPDKQTDRKSTRLNSSHMPKSRMPSSA